MTPRTETKNTTFVQKKIHFSFIILSGNPAGKTRKPLFLHGSQTCMEVLNFNFTKLCFLGMFTEGGITRKHRLLAMFRQQTHCFLAMFQMVDKPGNSVS
jgi:hypothetical protein